MHRQSEAAAAVKTVDEGQTEGGNSDEKTSQSAPRPFLSSRKNVESQQQREDGARSRGEAAFMLSVNGALRVLAILCRCSEGRRRAETCGGGQAVAAAVCAGAQAEVRRIFAKSFRRKRCERPCPTGGQKRVSADFPAAAQVCCSVLLALSQSATLRATLAFCPEVLALLLREGLSERNS